MAPDSPENKSTLGVILWRLDSLDRNLARVTTREAHHSLQQRVERLEQEEHDRDEWGRQITAGVILAALGAVGSLIVALLGG